MRAVYKNPKELATAIKDLVDNYMEDLLTEDKFELKLKRIVDSNVVYKNGKIEGKIANVLGQERMDIIDKVIMEK